VSFEIIMAISFALLVILLVTGAPFYVAFLAGSIPFLLFVAEVPGISLGALAKEAVNSFTLIAIPLFIFLGSIMGEIGATADLFRLASAFLGHIKGGLGMATIIACTLFGAMCGSGLATAMAIGAIAIPELTKKGYDRGTIGAICGTAGGLGLIIPPSIGYIILADVLGCSVGQLFIAGIVPGILACVMLCIACYIYCRPRKEIQVSNKYTWKERGKATVGALPPMVIPAAIMGSIYGGIATPTEAAGVACFVSLLLGLFYYRTLNMDIVWKTLKGTVKTTSAVWCIIVGAVVFGKVLAFESIPQAGGELIASLQLSEMGFIFAFLGLFFILGMFFDAFILVLACLPPLIGAITSCNINLIYFGILFQFMVIVGQCTPPVGITLYTAGMASGATTGEVIKAAPIFVAALCVTVIILIFLMPVLPQAIMPLK